MMIRTTVSALVLTAAAAVPATSMADVSANIGWVSDYFYRGAFQAESSASAGVDYTSGGFYLGTWAAKVAPGLETDLFFGYSGGDDFTYSIGYTGYFYTDDFDDTYQEINLGIGYGIFALDVAVGEWDGFGDSQDYTFTSVTISPEKGPYYKAGVWSGDVTDGASDKWYLELGYTHSFEEPGVDLSLALIYADIDATNAFFSGTNSSDWGLTVGFTKNFSLE